MVNCSGAMSKVMAISRIFWLTGLFMAGNAAWAQQANVYLPAPPKLEIPAPQATSTDGFFSGSAIQASSRAEVVANYHSRFVANANFGDAQMGWTGSTATCTVGTIAGAYQNATLGLINYVRAMAGLPDAVSFDATKSFKNQAAALMYSRNNDIDHFPPPSWPCYSAAGAEGGGNSNIALGVAGPQAIILYMDDPGAGNTAAGHRRWILYPPQTAMGAGSVPFNVPGGSICGAGSTTCFSSNALWTLGPFGARPATPNGTAWPPRGFVPFQILPHGSGRWSFSYPGANFSGATVTVSRVGAGALPVALDSTNDNGYGDNTIVFRPAGIVTSPPPVDVTYNVNIAGVSGAGVPPSFNYDVTVIDPAITPLVPKPSLSPIFLLLLD